MQGLWIWKHFAEWKMLERMKEGDVLLYIDSDFRCTAEIKQYFCLAHSHNVVGFHHSNAAYKLSRLASRDAMILMDLDSAAVADSVQASGGNILFRKSQFTVDFVKEMASYSQQHEIASGVGRDSQFGDNWPQYTAEKLHQCDQAISSLMLIKHKLKTFPWSADGYGAGSDDDLNLAQRAEAGLTRTSVGIHVRDDMKVAWTADQYS